VNRWWITPLFAHHAGIIDLESTEGGTCYDAHGAYALVLRETGETGAFAHSLVEGLCFTSPIPFERLPLTLPSPSEEASENAFTYRPQLGDKGKFRLTAGNARSRHPIRVLRCHSLNSVWGPKTGIRYEGL
jgi:hypothetical protein